jgi:hypothetical protein
MMLEDEVRLSRCVPNGTHRDIGLEHRRWGPGDE